MNWKNIKVGSTVVVLISSRQSYKPIEERYTERTIVGESSRSWIDSVGVKHPKKLQPDNVYTNWEQVQQIEWVEQNKYFIGEAIQRNYTGITYEQMKQIAAIIGYTGKNK